MFEDPNEIFNYLPINRNLNEDVYIEYLWDSFLTLVDHGGIGSSFAVMPFHLLFMLSLQYKVMRIYKEYPIRYKLAFTIPQARNNNEVSSPKSVFELAFLNERALINLLSIVNVNKEDIQKLKYLIDDRNDKLAHAKGIVILEIENIVREYIEILSKIQSYNLIMNNRVASRWLNKMGTGQDGVDYINTHMAEEYLCPADMQQGKLSKLDKRLNNEKN